MDIIFCPKHKIKTGLTKDKGCKSGWRCPKCNQPCVREKVKKQTKEPELFSVSPNKSPSVSPKKTLEQLKFDF